jgi:hypothetical protein
MIPISLQPERRRQRSPWASEALHLQLLQVAHAYGLDALVLSDSLGHLWAASSHETSPVGQIAGLASRSQTKQGESLARTRIGRKSLLVHKLEVGPATLFLAAQGAPRRSKPALEDAVPGVKRILSALL